MEPTEEMKTLAEKIAAQQGQQDEMRNELVNLAYVQVVHYLELVGLELTDLQDDVDN